MDVANGRAPGTVTGREELRALCPDVLEGLQGTKQGLKPSVWHCGTLQCGRTILRTSQLTVGFRYPILVEYVSLSR